MFPVPFVGKVCGGGAHDGGQPVACRGTWAAGRQEGHAIPRVASGSAGN